jgi:predicted acylesterase/phospholipase RssA
MRDELRVALVLNGGVSLAIWMSGVVTEIDALRASGPAVEPAPDPAPIDTTEDVYAALRDLLGLDVTVDVIAGTSAGGLNGALLGAAIASGNRLRGLRELWMSAGDLGGLIRPRGMPATSILLGDSAGPYPGLLGAVTGAIQTAVAAGGAEPRGDVRLTMTTTGINGVAGSPLIDSYGDPAERIEHRWRFRFAGAASPSLPGRATIGPGSVGALARAARSSSSFPFAFEPSSIDPSDAAIRESLHTAAEQPTPVFPEAASTPQKAVDGGVLDNSPIDIVLEDIAERRAGDAPIRRAIVFVVPYPGQSAESATAGPATLKDIAGTTFNLPRDVPDLNNLNLVDDYVKHHKKRMRTYDDLMGMGDALGAVPVRGALTRAEVRRIGRRVLSRLRDRRAELSVDPGATAWRERLRSLQSAVQTALAAADGGTRPRAFAEGQDALDAHALDGSDLADPPPAPDDARVGVIWQRLRAADWILHSATGLEKDADANDIGFTFMRLCADAAVPGAPAAAQPAGATYVRQICCPPSSKLYGLELGHFASFVRSSWRASDWMFGRLDGAARLVDVVLDVRALRDSPTTRAEMRTALEGLGFDLCELAAQVDAALASDPLPAGAGVDGSIVAAGADAPIEPGLPKAPSYELIVWRHAWRIALQQRIIQDELGKVRAAEAADRELGFLPNPSPPGGGDLSSFVVYYGRLTQPRPIAELVSDEMAAGKGRRLENDGLREAVRVLRYEPNGLPRIVGWAAYVYLVYRRVRSRL